MSWLLLLILAWKPIFWSGRALYHKIKGDTWDASGYWAQVKDWFTAVWALVSPLGV